MGARPLRRAIQRYIEDPLADEVLSQSMPPGSTVEVDTGAGGRRARGHDHDREAKGASARPSASAPQGGEAEEGARATPAPSSRAAHDLPDEPEVLPDVPDAPPADDEDSDPR